MEAIHRQFSTVSCSRDSKCNVYGFLLHKSIVNWNEEFFYLFVCVDHMWLLKTLEIYLGILLSGRQKLNSKTFDVNPMTYHPDKD